jgi:hypothetical protein
VPHPEYAVMRLSPEKAAGTVIVPFDLEGWKSCDINA